MSSLVEYLLNKASDAEIAEHLSKCDSDFIPPLSDRLQINDYAKKITINATRFEAWSCGILVGLVAVYCNDQEKHNAFITNVSVLREWMSKGISAHLMSQCIEYAKMAGLNQVSLEVACDNKPAIMLYKKKGFTVVNVNAKLISMVLKLKNGKNDHE